MEMFVVKNQNAPIIRNIFVSQKNTNSIMIKILDDIVKQGNKERKANVKTKTKKIATAASKAAKKNKNKKAIEADSKAASKVAQVTGKSKAKRNAKVQQKRGLATTGVANVNDIKKTIEREALKLAKQLVQKAQGNNNNNNKQGNGKQGDNKRKGSKPSIKVSFRPAELGRTTSQNVAKQIGAVLSKAPRKNKNNKFRKNGNFGNANRKVILQ